MPLKLVTEALEIDNRDRNTKKKEDVTLEKIKWVHERVWSRILRAGEIKVVQRIELIRRDGED